MFLFHRERAGTTEVFSIYVASGVLPEASQRFQPALRINARSERYFPIGTLVLIHDADKVDYFLATKAALTESEHGLLLQELELLAGQEVHTFGAEREQGWFHRDTLKSGTLNG